jgi:hypothetical protein
MRCPNCGSVYVRRSLRRGLGEGFFLRILFRAPYRCSVCGTRFIGTSNTSVFPQRKKHNTLAGYLGFPGGQKRKFRRALLFVALFVLLNIVASYLLLLLSKSGAPSPAP